MHQRKIRKQKMCSFFEMESLFWIWYIQILQPQTAFSQWQQRAWVPFQVSVRRKLWIKERPTLLSGSTHPPISFESLHSHPEAIKARVKCFFPSFLSASSRSLWLHLLLEDLGQLARELSQIKFINDVCSHSTMKKKIIKLRRGVQKNHLVRIIYTSSTRQKSRINNQWLILKLSVGWAALLLPYNNNNSRILNLSRFSTAGKNKLISLSVFFH